MIERHRSDLTCDPASPVTSSSRDAMIADVRRRLRSDLRGLAARSLASHGTADADAVAQCDRLVDELLNTTPRAHVTHAR